MPKFSLDQFFVLFCFRFQNSAWEHKEKSAASKQKLRGMQAGSEAMLLTL